ncbi:unnamed protein product [Calypogeia fissa]
MELRNGKKMRTIFRGKKTDGEELIPGIKDDVTLDHITTKLSGRDIHILASVSRGWRRAIQSRQVYNARLRHGATETFVLIYHSRFKGIKEIFLCSMKDKSCYMLPPIVSEFSHRGKPQTKLVALDGRVYLVGKDLRLYVLDLAGQRQWKRCSSRGAKRFYDSFECGVMDGKIYVLTSDWSTIAGDRSQVYDLKLNTWSSIKPMPLLRDRYQLAVMRDELVLHSGKFGTESAECLNFYNPIKEEWRSVENVKRRMEQLFVAGGRLYSMSSVGIHVYAFHGNSWAEQHTFSFSAITQFDIIPLRVLAVDDELLAILYFKNAYQVAYRDRSCLVRSKGFNSQNKELLWESAEFNAPCIELSRGDYSLYSISPIQF